MTQQETVQKWIQSAEEDLQTAEILLNNKKYAYCLFFCHITVEKMLKALVIRQTDEAPPVSHNLLQLARTAHLPIDATKEEALKEITTFNVEARYDIIKQTLYKKATPDYTIKYVDITKELILWIKQNL